MNQYNRTLPARASSSSTARTIVAAEARRLSNMADADIDDLCVAVGEAFANVVRHGDPTAREPVHLRVEHRADRLMVHLIYRSAPFNTSPRPPEPDEMMGGGYGLFIMRTLADVVEFTFRNGATHLCLAKRCKAVPSARSADGMDWNKCAGPFALPNS